MQRTMSVLFLIAWLNGLTVATAVAEETGRGALHIRAQDFTTTMLGSEVIDGHVNTVIQAQARNQQLAEALGYCRIRAWFDTESRVTRKVILLDVNDKKLTTVRFFEFYQLKGETRAKRMEVNDHRNGQITVYELGNASSPFTFM